MPRDDGFGTMWRRAPLLLQTLLWLLAACSRPPEDPESRHRLTVRARALLENGDAGAAQKLLEKVADAGRRPEAWVNLGLVQHARGNSRAAAKSWNTALEAEPTSVRALYHTAALHVARAEKAGAEARERPKRAEKLEARARDELRLAASLLERAAASDAQNAAIPRLQERVHLALGDSAAAATAGHEAARLDPVHAGTSPDVYGLARIQLPPLRRPVSISRTPPYFATTHTRFRAIDLEALDLDANGRDDLVLVGTAAALRCDSDPASVHWMPTRLLSEGVLLARTALLNDDSHPDLLLFTRSHRKRTRLQAWLVSGGTAVPRAESLLATDYDVHDVVPVDVDRDGDLDLVLAAAESPGLRLWRNDGRGHFAAETVPGIAEAWPPTLRVVSSDLDADGHADLVCVDTLHRLSLLGGRDRDTFVDRTMISGLAGRRARAVVSDDLDADGDYDLLLGDDEGLWVWANLGAARFELAAAYRETQSGWSGESPRGVAVAALHLADFDNDGLQDVLSLHFHSKPAEFAAASSEEAGPEDTAPITRRLEPLLDVPQAVRFGFWRNEGNGVFSDVTRRSRLDRAELAPRLPVSGDFDADGDLDVACVGADSLVRFLWNTGGNDNRRLEMELVDPQRPAASHGARVEIFAAGRVRHAEARGVDAWVGLGRIEIADVVRIVWPDGDTENHVDVLLPESGRLRAVRGSAL